jgi:hypothetical protein
LDILEHAFITLQPRKPNRITVLKKRTNEGGKQSDEVPSIYPGEGTVKKIHHSYRLFRRMKTHQRGGEIRSDPNTEVFVLVNGGDAMGSRWRRKGKHRIRRFYE